MAPDGSDRRGGRASRVARLTVACLAGTIAVGCAGALYAFFLGGPSLRWPGYRVLVAAALVASVTIANLALRYLRWHYLLRRLELRVQMVPSLGAYVGSFTFLVDPRRLPVPRGARLAATECMTFIPDFVPARLLPALARHAAHFVAVYERTAEAGSLAAVASGRGRG